MLIMTNSEGVTDLFNYWHLTENKWLTPAATHSDDRHEFYDELVLGENYLCVPSVMDPPQGDTHSLIDRLRGIYDIKIDDGLGPVGDAEHVIADGQLYMRRRFPVDDFNETIAAFLEQVIAGSVSKNEISETIELLYRPRANAVWPHPIVSGLTRDIISTLKGFLP